MNSKPITQPSVHKRINVCVVKIHNTLKQTGGTNWPARRSPCMAFVHSPPGTSCRKSGPCQTSLFLRTSPSVSCKERTPHQFLTPRSLDCASCRCTYWRVPRQRTKQLKHCLNYCWYTAMSPRDILEFGVTWLPWIPRCCSGLLCCAYLRCEFVMWFQLSR